MSVYIFGNGKSVYGDAVNKILSTNTQENRTSIDQKRPKLSTIILKENTNVSEIIDYSKTLRSELEEIRQIFYEQPQLGQTKQYDKFLKVQQSLMDYCDELIELYQSYGKASTLTANRKPAIREKILNVGLKMSGLIRSYNTSGIFAGRETLVTIPIENSYENVLRERLLKTLDI